MIARWEALHAAAEDADPGPWVWDGRECVLRDVVFDDGTVGSLEVAETAEPDNAAYIAAANPAAILALLADLDAAREALREALSAFSATQRLADYPPDHWAVRARTALARLDREPAP